MTTIGFDKPVYAVRGNSLLGATLALGGVKWLSRPCGASLGLVLVSGEDLKRYDTNSFALSERGVRRTRI